MKRKVQQIASDLAQRLSRWDSTEAILLGDIGDIEMSDPYFTIELDVYLRDGLPAVEMRRGLFADAEAFESSLISSNDRFLLATLPVSVHYMETNGIDRVLWRIEDRTWVFHEPGTHMFDRIEAGDVLFSRGTWIAETKTALADLPPEFWVQVRLRAFAAAERALSELGAAAFRADDMFFLVSSARLLRSVASFLFAVNHQFEPSPRLLSERIVALPVLPDGFVGRLESFLRPEPSISTDSRREIAELIVRSLIPLA
jgi:hypothetical protein